MAQEAVEPDFSVGDLLQEIRHRLDLPPGEVGAEGVYTTRELRKLTGKGQHVIYKLLHRLNDEGLLEQTTKVINPLGRAASHPVSAYRLKMGDLGEEIDGTT